MGLSELKVQRSAQKLLVRRYKGKSWGKQIFSQLEVRTKQKYGGKRADGLLAFKHLLWGEFVVSMEAKSFKTLDSIRPYKDHGSIILGSIRWGFYALIGSGAGVALIKQEAFLSKVGFPMIMFLLGAIIYALLTQNWVCHQMSNVIEQIRQYPGNHQWLAVSKDSLERLSKKKKQNFKRTCKHCGIGVIVVNKREKAKVWVRPRRNWNWFRSYLPFYSLEKMIRASI
jgi:hypothetical protein